MRLAVLLALGAAACGDDLSVVVDVTHPTPVHRTVISVYESDAVTCDRIEFGDLDEAALLSALVAEEVHDDKGALVSGDLDGISRTKDKAIVARGYDESGALITAQCVTKGVVHGTDHVKIETVVAATVSAVTDMVDSATINVLATTPDGVFLDKRRVSWHVYAPIGTSPYAPASVVPMGMSEWEPMGNACTNANGQTKLHPIPPTLIGGFATRIRASWAANTLPLQSAISKVDSDSITIKPMPNLVHACAVHITGTTRRLVCLDTQGGTGNPVAHELSITVNGGRITIATTGTSGALAPAPIGLVDLPGAAAGDQNVYAVTPSGSLTALFGAPVVPAISCPGCTGIVTDYVFAPSCGVPDNVPRLFLKFGTQEIVAMSPITGAAADVMGASEVTVDTVAFTGAGCVSEVTPQGSKLSRQVVTFDVTAGVVATARAFYDCDAASCHKLILPLFGAGVAFVETDKGELRLVGASIDATGVSMSSWVILPDPTTAIGPTATKIDRLLEKDRVAAASLPHKVLAGKFDDDDGYDLLWDVAAKRGSSLEIAYSRMAGDQRLEAVSAVEATDDLLLEDLSGDGHPDIVIVGADGTGALGTGVGLEVIPTHVPPATPAINIDDCK